MTELTLEEIDELEAELRTARYPNSLVIPQLCAAARAHIAGRDKYFTPEEQGRMTAAFEAATVSPGDEGLIELDRNGQTIDWLNELAERGGKGVVNNIDARALGRIATRFNELHYGIAGQLGEIASLRHRIGELEQQLAVMESKFCGERDGRDDDAKAASTRIAELEAQLAAAHVRIDELEKDRGVWRSTANNHYNEIERLRECLGEYAGAQQRNNLTYGDIEAFRKIITAKGISDAVADSICAEARAGITGYSVGN